MEQPVTLAATLTDPAVARPGTRFLARVDRAYRAALYVREQESRREAVIALADVGGVPGGILARDVADLRVVAAGRSVVVDLTAARAWSPRLPGSARTNPDVAAVARARDIAAEVVTRDAVERGFGGLLRGGAGANPFAAVAARHIDTLRGALLARDKDAAETAVAALIGLGAGLTPSGDDFVTGLLAALEATSHPMRDALAATIRDVAPGRTTSIGVALLLHACNGEFSERLHDVLTAIAGDGRDVRRAIRRATTYGATSGIDTLAGVFAGLEVAAARAQQVAA